MKSLPTISFKLFVIVFVCAVMISCLERKESISFGSNNNPAGTIRLTDGQIATKERSLKLLLESPDATEMAVYVDKPCEIINARWEPYTPDRTVELPDRDGTYSISAVFRNKNNFASNCQSLNVILDRTGPTLGSLGLTATHSSLVEAPTFNVVDVKDELSGFQSIEARVVQQSSQRALTAWLNFDRALVGQKIVGLQLDDGEIYVLEVRALDKAGNASPAQGVAFQAGPSILLTPTTASMGGNLPVSVILAAPTMDDFNIDISLESYTAIADVDFAMSNQTIKISKGSTGTTANVKVYETIQPGPPRKFFFKAQPSQKTIAAPVYTTISTPPPADLPPSNRLGLTGLPMSIDSTESLVLQPYYPSSEDSPRGHYYKVFSENNGDCNNAGGYRTAIAGAAIPVTLPQVADGTRLTLCALSQYNSVERMLKHTWISAGPTVVSFVTPSRNFLENTTQSSTITLSKALPMDVSINYVIEGNITASDLNLPVSGVTPNVQIANSNDFASGTATIPAGSTSTIINYQILRNTNIETLQKWFMIRITNISPSWVQVGEYPAEYNIIQDSDGNKNTLRYTKVTAGFTHTCALAQNATVYCWGRNDRGQLGTGSPYADALVPTPVSAGTTTYQALSAGKQHTCGLTSGGAVFCWGDNYFGQVGTAQPLASGVPNPVDVGTTYKRISASQGHTCGITISGVLKCWGDNSSGQLGDGSVSQRNTPVVIDSGVSYAEISAGYNYTCAVTAAGQLKCWGDNSSGQLGDGTINPSLVPKLIDAGTSYATVSTGLAHSCAVTTALRINCWGLNSSRQLGIAHYSGLFPTPTLIDSGDNYSAVAVGETHTCALSATQSGRVKCWGKNSSGVLGSSRAGAFTYPLDVDSQTLYSTLSTSSNHTCAVTNDGLLKCWGSNIYGGLGDGMTTIVPSPTPISSSTTYTAIQSKDQTTCALTNDGRIECWGDNSLGLLGIGVPFNSGRPALVDPDTKYTFLRTGISASCGITDSKVTKCWGSNALGILGDKSNDIIRYSPSVVAHESFATKVDYGDRVGCLVDDAFDLKCWGDNINGQVGDGTTIARTTPVFVSYYFGTLSLGWTHSCGILTSGALYCWGDNSNGNLGDNTTTQRKTPTKIGSYSYKDVAAGNGFTCGISTTTPYTNKMLCWGKVLNMNYGQVPTSINASISYKAVRASQKHACGITTSNKLYCWGFNSEGQLATPPKDLVADLGGIAIDPSTNYIGVAVGTSHTCGLTDLGQIKCWGSMEQGQLGIGHLPNWAPRIVLAPL